MPEKSLLRRDDFGEDNRHFVATRHQTQNALTRSKFRVIDLGSADIVGIPPSSQLFTKLFCIAVRGIEIRGGRVRIQELETVTGRIHTNDSDFTKLHRLGEWIADERRFHSFTNGDLFHSLLDFSSAIECHFISARKEAEECRTCRKSFVIDLGSADIVGIPPSSQLFTELFCIALGGIEIRGGVRGIQKLDAITSRIHTLDGHISKLVRRTIRTDLLEHRAKRSGLGVRSILNIAHEVGGFYISKTDCGPEG